MIGGMMNPTQLLDHIDIHGNMQVADFGSGMGHLTIAMAKRLAKSGTVHAFDVQKESLETLRRDARAEGVLNIQALWTDLENPKSTKLADHSMDLVMIANVLFQSDAKDTIIAESARIVKPSGKVVVSDWSVESVFAGPPSSRRIPKDSMKELFRKQQLHFVKEIPAGAHHYAMIFATHE